MSAPSLCTISGTVYIAATGQGGVLVRWRVVSDTPPVTSGGGWSSGDPMVVYTGSDGSWSISAPQGLSVWLEIPAAGVDHVFAVPAATTATLSDVSLNRRTV